MKRPSTSRCGSYRRRRSISRACVGAACATCFATRSRPQRGTSGALCSTRRSPAMRIPPLFVGRVRRRSPTRNTICGPFSSRTSTSSQRSSGFSNTASRARLAQPGAFALEPERDAQTERCTLFLDGALHVGEQTVASKLRGWSHAQLDRHDPRLVQGAQISSGNLHQCRAARGCAGLGVYRPLSQPSRYRAETRRGHLARSRAARARRVDGEHRASVCDRSCHRDADSWSAIGPLTLAADIVKGGPDASLELTATSPRLRFSARGSPKDIGDPQARSLRLVVGTTANLARPIELRSLQVRLAVEVPELRWIDYALQRENFFTHGSARTDVDLRWSKGKLGGGKIALDARKLASLWRATQFRFRDGRQPGHVQRRGRARPSEQSEGCFPAGGGLARRRLEGSAGRAARADGAAHVAR